MGGGSGRDTGGQGRIGGRGARAWTAAFVVLTVAVVALGVLGRPAAAPSDLPSQTVGPVAVSSAEAARLAPAPGDVPVPSGAARTPFAVEDPDGTILVDVPLPGDAVAPGTILVEGLAFGLDSDLLAALQIGETTVATGVTRVAPNGAFTVALRWDGTLPESPLDGAIVFAETDQPDYDLASYAVRILPPQTSPRIPEAKPGWIPGHPF